MNPKVFSEKDELYFPCAHEYAIEKNPYSTLLVDVTQRCNLDCNVCFSAEHSNRFDFTLEYFEEACQRLPFPVNFKFIGGEPTMHPDFFDFLRIANRTGHRSYFSSNGLKFLDDDFMRELAELQFGFSPGITLDGGFSAENAENVYTTINGRPLLKKKMAALEQLKRFGIGRVVLNAILIRDLNEYVVKDLIDLAKEHSDIVRYIHFRNMTKIGDWLDNEPFSMDEMKGLMTQHFSADQMVKKSLYEVICLVEKGQYNTCCHRFRPDRRLQISLIDFCAPNARDCPYKGTLIDERFVTQGVYERMWAIGKFLSDKLGTSYGEHKIQVTAIEK